MTDLISREAAIAVLRGKMTNPWNAGFNAGVQVAIKALTNMPSAESELQEEIADLQSQVESWQHAAQYPGD